MPEANPNQRNALPVNGDLINAFKTKKGWSSALFADKAGVSEYVMRSALRSGNLYLSNIALIAGLMGKTAEDLIRPAVSASPAHSVKGGGYVQSDGSGHLPSVACNAPPAPYPFFGRSDDLEDVFGRLHASGDPERRKIAIFGKIGQGKSTFLAHLAWEKRMQSAYPDGIFWSALGQNPISEAMMLADWCRLAGVEAAGLLPREMAARLGQELFGKRVLLLIDDVWRQSDIGYVERLLHPTVSLVITSRLPIVAHNTAPKAAVCLPAIDEAAALALLRYFAPNVVSSHEMECRALVNDLERLPIAVQVAGQLLAARERSGIGLEGFIPSLRKMTDLLDKDIPSNMRPFISEANANLSVAALVRTSVDFLEDDTRSCFYCLGVMAPKPATFALEDILPIWSFVKNPLDQLQSLIDMGLLDTLTNGRYQMHALLVAYARAHLGD